jgi:hypothetical protein
MICARIVPVGQAGEYVQDHPALKEQLLHSGHSARYCFYLLKYFKPVNLPTLPLVTAHVAPGLQGLS